MKRFLLLFLVSCGVLVSAVKQPTFFARRDYTGVPFDGDAPFGGQIAVGDVNGDNKLDILFSETGPHGIRILLGNGTGTFHSGPISRTCVIGYPVVRDLNGDGILDLVGMATQGTSTG